MLGVSYILKSVCKTYLQILAHLGYLQHDGAFDPFFMELAAQVIDSGDGAGGVVGVGSAAAAAVELGEAVGAFFVGVDIAALELIADGSIGDAVVDVAQQEIETPTNW